MLKVSVIMSAYNAGDSLFLAVKSICQQTLQEWELILLDDGSTDGSFEKIYGILDNRIRILRDNLNRGLSFRLNQGILLSRSKYIARMDADDISFSKRLELQFNFLEKNKNIDLISCRTLVFTNNNFLLLGLLPYKQEHSSITSMPWRSIPMPHPTWMGRADWFRSYFYKVPEVPIAEDQEILYRSMDYSKFYTLPDILFCYRQNSFNFRKTLKARLSLVKIQFYYFLRKKKYFFILNCFIIFFINFVLDIFVRKLINKKNFFFLKFYENKQITESIRNEFNLLITSIKK